MYRRTVLNHELILNGSQSFSSSVYKNGAGHLGWLLPSGGIDIAVGLGLPVGGGGGGTGGGRLGLGFLVDRGLRDAGGAGPAGAGSCVGCSGSGLGAPS